MAAALIFAAAPIEPTPRLRARLGQLHEPHVIAADGGAATARAFGYRPDVVIGDFDSLEPSTLRDVPVEPYPRDKDRTDGQLAIERALQYQPEALYLVGFLGGPRLDMAVANVLLASLYEVPITLLDERNEAIVLRAPITHAWEAETDEVISLIPLDDNALVTTQGLRWTLNNEHIPRGDTRGLSNEPVSTTPRVELDRGLVLLTRHFARV